MSATLSATPEAAGRTTLPLPAVTPGTAAYQAAPPTATTATTGAIPQISAQQIMAPTGYGVAQNTTNYSYNPATASGTPTGYNATTSNAGTGYNAATTNLNTGYNAAQSNLDLSSAGFTAALQAAQAPQNLQSQRALQESLAANGVIGGGGVGAMQQLGLQQNAQFQGAEQAGLLSLDNTALAQSQGNQNATNTASQFGIQEGLNQAQTNAANQNAASQFGISNALNQSEYNTGQTNAASQFGVTAGQNAAQFNAGQQNAQQQYTLSNWGQEEQANTAALNAQSQFNDTNQIGIATQNAANNLTAQGENQSANLNAGEFNAQETNATNQFNIANQIKQAQGNDETYNTFLAQQQANANQDWLAQLQSQTQLSTNGASNQTTALNPVYTQPASPSINFSNLGSTPTPTPTPTPAAVSPGSNASKSTL